MISYDAPTVYGRFARDVIPLEPDVVTLMMGTFHIRRHRPEVAPDLYDIAVRAIVDLAEANDIDLILLTSPTTTAPEIERYIILWAPLGPSAIAEAVGQLNDIAAEYAPMIIDAAAEDWPDSYWADTTHFNEDGHIAFAAYLDQAFYRDLCTQ